MAYGNKYKLKWQNYFAENCECYIMQDGYSDSVTNAIGGKYPLRIFWDSQDGGVFDPIIGSHCEIELIVETNGQYDEFANISDKEYKIEYYIDSTLFWSGFLVQGGVSELYNQAPFVILLEATDELGNLKNIEYLDTDGEPFGFPNHGYSRYALSVIIGNCLSRTGISRKVYEGINVYETNNDTGDGDSMLTQNIMHQHTFVDNNERRGESFSEEYISCYDVLKIVLETFSASIMQHAGAWHIVRKNQKGEYTRRLWNTTNSFQSGAAPDSNDAYTPTLALSNAQAALADLNVVLYKSAYRSREEGLKEMKIKHDLGVKNNLIDISFDNTSEPPEWTNAGTVLWDYSNGSLKVYSNGETIFDENRSLYLDFPSLYPLSSNLLEFSIKGQVVINFAVSSPNFLPILAIEDNNGDILNKDTGLFETPSASNRYCTIKMDAPLAVGTYDFNETVKLGTFTSHLYIRLRPPLTVNEYHIKKNDIVLKYDNYDSYNEYLGSGNSNNLKELKLEVSLGDSDTSRLKGSSTFNTANDCFVLKNILYYDTGWTDYTTLWANKGSGTYKTILQHLATNYMNIYSTAPFKLTGRFKAHFNILSLINDGNELYTITRLEREEKYCEHEIEAIEVGKTQELAGDYILTEDGLIIAAEDGTTKIIKE